MPKRPSWDQGGPQ